jgi:hypothetical protein
MLENSPNPAWRNSNRIISASIFWSIVVVGGAARRKTWAVKMTETEGG